MRTGRIRQRWLTADGDPWRTGRPLAEREVPLKPFLLWLGSYSSPPRQPFHRDRASEALWPPPAIVPLAASGFANQLALGIGRSPAGNPLGLH
jgi:hypothetical protein